jgi:SAM-dependent methyltransferase
MGSMNIFRALRRRQPREPVDSSVYWEERALDLVAGYDHPETWAERGWMVGGVEEEFVPKLLREQRISSVLVVGAGTGRQYEFLSDLDVDVRGFDISPTLVRAARERHPEIETLVDDIIGADQRHEPVDVVLATAVLQHVAPETIADAARSIEALALRMIVLREATWLAVSSNYQWAHDYDALFHRWRLAERIVTDENARYRVELRALVSPSA